MIVLITDFLKVLFRNTADFCLYGSIAIGAAGFLDQSSVSTVYIGLASFGALIAAVFLDFLVEEMK